jgi:hypothetical protein
MLTITNILKKSQRSLKCSQKQAVVGFLQISHSSVLEITSKDANLASATSGIKIRFRILSMYQTPGMDL